MDDDEDQGTPDPDAEVYCICRRPDNGTFMIGCDGGCDDWFHGKCVKIEERDKNLIDRYICPTCEDNGKGHTTWKRMCRRAVCRMPARISGKKAKADGGSKYCSEECGIKFMKEMVAKTRGVNDEHLHRRSMKRKSTAGTIASEEDAEGNDNDLGARGGALSAGELKALVVSVNNVDEFRRLGDGVLSPPATPAPKADRTTDSTEDCQMTDRLGGLNSVETARLADIAAGREASRARHALLKDRMKFITMVKEHAVRLAAKNDLKAKDFCGYDSRLQWSDQEFDAWRVSTPGSAALQSGSLQTSADTNAQNDDKESTVNGVSEVCAKRKCARHFDWSKLAIDETRYYLSQNSEVMRGLEREEKEIKARAGLRIRELQTGEVGGIAEVHDKVEVTDSDKVQQDSIDDKMDIDQPAAGLDQPELPATTLHEHTPPEDSNVDLVPSAQSSAEPVQQTPLPAPSEIPITSIEQVTKN